CGLGVSEFEVAANEPLPDVNPKRIELERFSTCGGSALPVPLTKVDQSQLSEVIRTPRIDGDGAVPESDGVLVSTHLRGQIGRSHECGFPAKFLAQSFLEGGERLVVAPESAQDKSLGLPSGHVIWPRYECCIQ